MAKLVTSDLSSLENQTSAITTINNNFTAVETALENTVSRDGMTPNTMSADFDMNGYDILNLPAPTDPTSPVRAQDMEDYIDQINGTSGSIINSPATGDVNKVAKATAAGIVGFADVIIDSSQNLSPNVSDVGALGTTSKMWADGFFANGAVLNFNAGNYTITHTAGNLAFSGTTTLTGVVTATAGVRPLANDGAALGSASLSWADLFLASGAVLNFNNGNLTLTHAAGQLTNSGNWINTGTFAVTSTSALTGNVGVGQASAAGARVGIAAGTSAIAPIVLTAGTNLTTPTAGAIEYDGMSMYGTTSASSRGVIPTEKWQILLNDYTLTSTTNDQKLFNASTNGALTVSTGKTYEFEAVLHITGMSATSGNATFNLLGAGTAVLDSTKFVMLGLDAAGTAPAITTAAGSMGLSEDNSSPTIAVAAVNTNLIALIKGVVRVATAGTIIPSIGLTTAAAAVVRANSYIKITPIGSNTVTTIGNWS